MRDSEQHRWGDAEGAVEPPAPRRGIRRAVLAAVALGGVALLWAVADAWRRERGMTPPLASAPAGAPAADRPQPDPAALVAEAQHLADELLRDFPDSVDALLLAGRILYAFNDVPRAQQCWAACLERWPDQVAVRCALAEAAWEHGDFEQTADQLRRAWQTQPALDQKLLFFLADALMNLGESREAVTVLERVDRDRPLTPFGRFLLGQAYLQVDDFASARTQFEKVLAADPQSINAHFGLATVYKRLGRPEEARRHQATYARLRKGELEESARLRPAMRKADWADPTPVVRESYLNAGKVAATSGRLVQAERYWLRAVELDPQNPRARELLGRLYQDQGRSADAARLRAGAARR